MNGAAWLNVLSEGNARVQLLNIKTNIQGFFEDYRLTRNLVFMRCICT